MNRIKILGTVLILVLVAASVVTATSNDKLPTKEEVTNLLSEMKGSSASDILDKIKEDHPAWNADLIECSTCSGSKEAVVLYYTDSASTKGYGSVYFKDGQAISPTILKGYTTKESYKGELEDSVKEENTTKECKDGSCTEEVKDTKSKDVSIESGSKISVEDRKAAFMKFLETKDSITLDELQEELDKDFPDDMEV